MAETQEKLPPTWQCEVRRSPEQQVPNFEGLTVGEVFELKCNGDEVAWKSAEDFHFVDSAKDSFVLKLLEVQQARPTGGEFLVTTYRAPQQEIGPVELSDGTISWSVVLAGTEVASVLPEEASEPPAPYGPYGPFILALPLWIWLLVIPLLLALAAPIALLWRRWKRRRRLKTALAESQSVLAPLSALHKAQRQTLKSLYVFKSADLSERRKVLEDLNRSVQVFLLHEFNVLLNDNLSAQEEKILRSQIKRSSLSLIKDLKMVFRELKRAEDDAQKVNAEQVQQLIELIRGLAQKLTAAKISKKKGARRGVA